MTGAVNVIAGRKGFVSLPVETRFWAKVERSPGCWLWTGSRAARGYGYFWRDGRLQPAHRVAYELERGAVPKGLVIDHLCHNTSCVNPAHLEAVSQAVNVSRGIARIRLSKAQGVSSSEVKGFEKVEEKGSRID